MQKQIDELILISCVGEKNPQEPIAREFYSSDWFKKAIGWYDRKSEDAKNNEKLVMGGILSAKHGLISFYKWLEPYEKTLNDMNVDQRQEWTKLVCKQFADKYPVTPKKITILAGQKYREFLEPWLRFAYQGTEVDVPMKGLGIGQQKQWLMNN